MTLKLLCALTGHPPSEYLFDLQYADCNRLDNPKISDLLEDAAEHHHIQCGCAFAIGSVVYSVALPATDEAIGNFTPDDSTRLGLDTPLHSVQHPGNGRIGFVILAETRPSTDYLRLYRMKRFTILPHANTGVLQRFGEDLQLPGPHQVHYNAMCRIRGLTIVDKTPFVHAFLEHCMCPIIPIIRRPKGFGKTTFLTTVESFFDVLALHAYFPFMNQEHTSSPAAAYAHHRLLVLRLDFNDLQLREDISVEDAYDECERFSQVAARNFYFRYKSYLEPYAATRRNWSIDFAAVIAAAKGQGLGIFLSIDNYTAPAKYRSLAIMEAVGETILVELGAAVYGGFVRCGMIVGDTVPQAPPWSHLGHFIDYTNDLSEDPSFYRAIGFTQDEVEALGEACSIPMSAFLACLGIDKSLDGASSPAVYCTADVLSIARQFVYDRSSHPSPQTAGILPTLPSVHAPQQHGLSRELSDSDMSEEHTADDLGMGLDNLPDDDEAFWTMLQKDPSYIASLSIGSTISKTVKVISPKSSPGKSDASSPRGSASSRSYNSSFMSSGSTTSSDPPSSPTDERGARR